MIESICRSDQVYLLPEMKQERSDVVDKCEDVM